MLGAHVVGLLLALLGTTTKAEHEMEGRLLLDVVVRKSATVLELLSGKDQALLIRWDALLVLDFGLDIVDSVRRLDLKGDGFARKAKTSQYSCSQSDSKVAHVLTKICTEKNQSG